MFSFDFKHKNSPMLVSIVSVIGLEALVLFVVVSHVDAITIRGTTLCQPYMDFKVAN